MKKQLTGFMLAACILQTFGLVMPAFSQDYHAARRENAEARHERYQAREDSREGNRFRSAVHGYQASREEKKAWKNERGY